ncbi:hypothetical protein pb186bvf_002465 [Paramecium bursaria]
MEILKQEEEQFKYKVANVFFQYIRYSLFLIFIGYQSIKLLDDDKQCGFQQETYISTLYHGGLILLLFNIIGAAYILYQKNFARIEFFITYGLNLFWVICMLLFSVQQLLSSPCQLADLAVKYFIYLSFFNQLDVIIIMMFKHEIANRQVNICSNMSIVLLIFTSKIAEGCAINIISIEIMLISANSIALLFFTGINISIVFLPKQREQLSNAFKFVCILVICFIILNYLVIVYYVEAGDIIENRKCLSIDFITRTYCYTAPITMLGIFPIMNSLNFSFVNDDEEEIIVQQQGFQQSRITLNPMNTPKTNPNYVSPYKIIVNQSEDHYMSRK